MKKIAILFFGGTFFLSTCCIEATLKCNFNTTINLKNNHVFLTSQAFLAKNLYK